MKGKRIMTLAELKCLFGGKTEKEILKDIEKKYADDFESLIEFHNLCSSCLDGTLKIVENTEDCLNEVVPEDARLITMFNSMRISTYFHSDKYAVYVDKQIFTFNDFLDDYCPITFERLADKIATVLSKETESCSYEEQVVENYEFV